MNNGYVIAKNKGREQFFTSSSSYDRPNWIPIDEATIYPTAEIAQRAVSKLWNNGSYSAKIISLSEMKDLLPTTSPKPEDEMIADADEDSDDSINLDADTIELVSDDNLEDEENEPEYEENEMAFTTPIEQKLMKGQRSKYPTGVGPSRMTEAKLPSKPKADLLPDENDTTAVDLKQPEVIKYKQQLNTPADVNFSDEIDSLHNPNNTPNDILQSLKDSIKQFDEVASYNNGKDDAQASMALTISAALSDILADLSLGTKEGLHKAQTRFTSYMNPITTNFPPDVVDYLYKKGRQPLKLKNIFYDKWDNLKK